jgi:energy-coupling factor transporter ATP-binding protein EcfA2
MTEAERAAVNVRIDRLHEEFLPYDKVAEIQIDIERLQTRDNGGSEGGILLLTGPSRSGKSKLLKDHASRYNRTEKAILIEGRQWFDRVPVVYMEVPDTNTKNLNERYLATLLGTSTKDVHKSGASRFMLQDDIKELVTTMEVQLTIFDEAHQGIDTKSVERTKETAVVFKDYSNWGKNSLVVAGTERVLRLIEASPEFSGRVVYDHELTPFEIDDPAGWRTFLDLLDVIDDYLCREVFGRKSGLAEPKLATPLLLAARGLIGHAAVIIEMAANDVFDNPTRSGKARQITLENLGRGFLKTPLRRGIENPFPTGGVKPVPDTETNDIVTRNRGRAHTTNKDAELRR